MGWSIDWAIAVCSMDVKAEQGNKNADGVDCAPSLEACERVRCNRNR